MHRRTLRHIAFMLFALCAVTPLLGLRTAVRAQATQAAATWAEVYTLAQFAKGEVADLTPMPEEERVVSGAFLKRLLLNSSNAAKLGSQGVRIKGVVVEGNLELSNEEIPYSVSLISCRFKGLVSFFHVSIK